MTTNYVKKDHEAEIVAMFIEALKNGDCAWQKPYYLDAPRNPFSGSEYKGFNALWAAMVAMQKGYKTPAYGTFKQVTDYAKKRKLEIDLKGQKTIPICYYKWVPKIEVVDGKNVDNGYPVLKTYSVFNIEQMVGLDADEFGVVAAPFVTKPILEAATMVDIAVKNLGVKRVEFSAMGAFYNPITCEISSPPIEFYEDAANYYGSIFHELVHASGHKDHLNRKSMADYFSDKELKSLEELTAEIGSAMLLDRCGLLSEKVQKNKQAYCNGWAAVLTDKPKWLMRAANAASKAVDYILGISDSEQEEE